MVNPFVMHIVREVRSVPDHHILLVDRLTIHELVEIGGSGQLAIV